MTPREALEKLEQGNERFLSGPLQAHEYDAERADLILGQSPFAVVLSCSDSRVPPELVFDASLGELFVIRVAGHVVSRAQIGSIEYAVEMLGSPLVLVLGHQNCGAVGASFDASLFDSFSPNLRSIVEKIHPVVSSIGPHAMDQAIEANVRACIRRLVDQSFVVSDRVTSESVRVVGAVYSLESGKVTFLD